MILVTCILSAILMSDVKAVNVDNLCEFKVRVLPGPSFQTCLAQRSFANPATNVLCWCLMTALAVNLFLDVFNKVDFSIRGDSISQDVILECNTSCVLPCPFFSTCVLVSSPTTCCPKATCRRRQIFTISPPIPFTIEPPKVTAIVKPGGPVKQIP
ncbi:hypothetical protein NECAME_10408 [Necator americanus]|uniref:ET module n=1 Tax=Necator americanus TaxID=51031 RepID=W2T9T1_NECAM|nr:hypothetical protein NECAME_10408 [Necator americanus]ETN78344.1 hypothetical protein NECAME_10408 [Necator americanus]